MVATAATAVMIDWNITGHEVSAVSGALSDMPVQLFEWAHMMEGYSMLLPAPGPGSSLAATIANTVRTLFYIDFPDSTFMCNAIFNSALPCLSTPAVAAPWFLWPHHIPDYVRCLTTLAMLKELPIEFGLTTGRALVNFKHEVVLSGNPANNGFATRMGMPEEWA